MAKLHKAGTTLLVVVTNARGKTLRAVRSDGHILKCRESGGHVDAGVCKPDLTVGAIADIYAKRWGAENVAVRVSRDTIPNPAAKHAARVRATEKRQAVQNHRHAVAQSAEAALGLPPLDVAWTPQQAENAVAHLVTCLRASGGRSAYVLDGRLAYIADMARFHGGQTGGNLGTAIMADMRLPREARPFTREFDSMADELARRVYGSDMRAAERWHRAMHG